MKYKSKIDVCIYLIFSCILIVPVGLTIWFIVLGSVVAVISVLSVLLLVSALLVIPIWLNTYYVLEEGSLFIKSGFCLRRNIEYGSIMNIRETSSPLASPALSFDRIELEFRKGNLSEIVLISPQNKLEFMQKLIGKIELAACGK